MKINMVIRFVGVFLCLGFSAGVHARNLEAIIILDDAMSENHYTADSGTLVLDLDEALQQKTAPIIVSGVVLHAFWANVREFSQKLSVENSQENALVKLVDQLREKKQENASISKKLEENIISDNLIKISNNLIKGQREAKQKELEKLYSQKKDEIEKLDAKKGSHKERMALYNQLHEIQTQQIALYDSFKPDESNKLFDERLSLYDQRSPINDAMNALYAEFEQYKKPDRMQYASYLANFSFEEWTIYKHVQADLYLLMPKAYEERVLKEFSPKNDQKVSRGFTVREMALGFAVDHRDIMKVITSEIVLFEGLTKVWGTTKMKLLGKSDVLSYLYFKDKPIAIDSLQSLFVTGKGDGFGYWNLYMIGHGSSSDKQYIPGATLKKAKSGSDPRAFIAGLKVDDFFKMMSFFSQDLQAASLYYNTCYGGGYNQSLVEQALQQIHEEKQLKGLEKEFLASTPVDFMVISGALTDSVTWNSLTRPDSLVAFLEKKPLFNFNGYFAHMRDFFSKTLALYNLSKIHKEIRFRKQLPEDQEKQSPEQQATRVARLYAFYVQHEELLKEALGCLTPWQQMGVEDLHGIAGVPSLWYPGSKKFKAVPVGQALVIIDNELLAFEKPVVVPNTTKAVLVYPSYVGVPVSIVGEEKDYYHTLPAFVSMQPGEALHTLKQLTVNLGEKEDMDKDGMNLDKAVEKFVRESLFSLKSVYKKKWFINRIVFVGLGEIEDLAVREEQKIAWITTEPAAFVGSVVYKVKDQQGSYSYYKGSIKEQEKKYRLKTSFKKISQKASQKEYKSILGEKQYAEIFSSTESK